MSLGVILFFVCVGIIVYAVLVNGEPPRKPPTPPTKNPKRR